MKVVTAREMARIEGLAYAAGVAEVDFMEKAGAAIAESVDQLISSCGWERVVTLLVGKGNNGGDAYVAGRCLLEKGYTVIAYHIYSLDVCGPLCKAMCEAFKQKGGRVFFSRLEGSFSFEPEGLILDGLVGTGFHGKAEGMLAQAIVAANESQLPVIAIDIPSGVNGDTGEVETVAVHADATIFLELPKAGFFKGDGWNYVGQLIGVSFGLQEEYVEQAKAEGIYVSADLIADLLPPMFRTRHKYQAGYVLGVAGSFGMPGAALLASKAALHSGAGIVRLFHLEGMQAEMSHAPYELIKEGWNRKSCSKILTEAKRAKAVFIGPGIGRDKEWKKPLKTLFSQLTIPCVIDADALYFIGESSGWKLPKHCVLTPHHQEMEQLLGGSSKDLFGACQRYVNEKKVTLVLKGAPTWVFHPGEKPVVIAGGDPGMATAGAGDVLTGMIAALIAQGMDCRWGAILGALLHAKSGELAADDLTSYCMTASDLIDYLPGSFAWV